MHQIVLLTALTATTGLFGGGRSCGSRGCGRQTMSYSACAPSYGHGYGYGYGSGYGCQSGTSCGVPAYAPPPPAYGAPQAPAPQTAYYPSYYNTPTTYGYGCAGGNCYGR